VNAVDNADCNITGATVYLNLEPCCHYGKTPPCVNLFLTMKPARMVIAMEDPNPLVSGEGIATMRDADIEVEVGLLEEEARRLNASFIKYITTGMPYVTAKCAMTLDGKIATRTGHSRWVTGEAARVKVHEMRNFADAILVGSRTLMMDDPSLTTRIEVSDHRDPIRIILDAGEYLDQNRRVFKLESDAPTWVAVTRERDYPGADEVIQVPKGSGGIDMLALMQELGKREVGTLLIEGGGTTLASAFEADIVDRVAFFIAPKIVGGRDAITSVEGEGVAYMDDAIKLGKMTITPVGDDILIEADVLKEN
jgi:diaminohydroxyphosphoribosylaminopyrimidine deaminase/5-amino-6-(5-phosphoribosylamino)uracil reductase